MATELTTGEILFTTGAAIGGTALGTLAGGELGNALIGGQAAVFGLGMAGALFGLIVGLGVGVGLAERHHKKMDLQMGFSTSIHLR